MTRAPNTPVIAREKPAEPKPGWWEPLMRQLRGLAKRSSTGTAPDASGSEPDSLESDLADMPREGFGCHRDRQELVTEVPLTVLGESLSAPVVEPVLEPERARLDLDGGARGEMLTPDLVMPSPELVLVESPVVAHDDSAVITRAVGFALDEPDIRTLDEPTPVVTPTVVELEPTEPVECDEWEPEHPTRTDGVTAPVEPEFSQSLASLVDEAALICPIPVLDFAPTSEHVLEAREDELVETPILTPSPAPHVEVLEVVEPTFGEPERDELVAPGSATTVDDVAGDEPDELVFIVSNSTPVEVPESVHDEPLEAPAWVEPEPVPVFDEIAPVAPEDGPVVVVIPELDLASDPEVGQSVPVDPGRVEVVVVPPVPALALDEVAVPADAAPASPVLEAVEAPCTEPLLDRWQDDQWPDGGIVVSPVPGQRYDEPAAAPEAALEAPGEVAEPSVPELAVAEPEPVVTPAPEPVVAEVPEPELQVAEPQQEPVITEDDAPAARPSWFSSCFSGSRAWLSDKQALARRWVAELRSGRHEQVCGAWTEERVWGCDKECSVQVAKNTFNMSYQELERILGPDVLDGTLYRNDCLKLTFDKVADYIEDELELKR